MGQAVRHEWDARDRLSKKILARTVSGGSSEHPEIRYTYETWGPLHDARHFAKSSDTTPMKTITYLRNRAGDVTAVSDDSIQATPLYGYTVDKLGRTTQATAKYLPGGDRPIDYAFDARGDLLTLTLTDPNEVLVHAYTYAADSGKIATATFPGSAMPIAITRWPHDGEKVVTYPGGVTREVDYDVRGPVSEIRIKPAAGTPLIEKWAYTYTDVLSVATMTDSASRVTTYGYDSLDRLTSADHPTLPPPLDTLPSLETFTYDGVGNRTMSGYAHDANHRMRTSPGHSYDYDDDGNTKVRDPGTSGQASYTWDLDNRLTAYASGATSVAYTQDPFARRLKKTVGSTTTWYLWSGDRLLAAYSGTGTRTARYTPLGGFAPAQMALPNGGSELIYDVHSDRLDTPRVMTSSGGSVVWQAAYEAYGQAHVSTAISTPLNVRLPGQYLDAESSLHDNLHRYFDPAVGRYISADPIGQAGGINVYRYARNNPLRFIDPLGLEEGSPSNIQKRKAVADWAAAQSGSVSPYDYGSYHSPQYPKDSYKCSAFTCDAAASSGAPTTVTVPGGKSGTTTRCPTAAELARGSVPDWRTLGPGESPQAGDIAAAPIPGGVDYTGHAAVVTDDGAGGTTTVGAHHDQVGPPGADTFRSKPTYRRYTGD